MSRTPFIHILTVMAFLANVFGPICPISLVQAQQLFSSEGGEFRLPAIGVRVGLSPEFNPPILKGIKVHPDNPFLFDFILDQGDDSLLAGRVREGGIKQEATKLIKYFLASLTIPEKDLWVNLSPYEKNHIVPEFFGQTEMGRDLLAEDYMLKQITASLIYPEDEIGKKFWKRIYEEAAKKYGTTNIPVNTFNKVWIVPEKAVVYENAKTATAYVMESKLKVMLEQDYLALEKNSVIQDRSALGNQIVRANPATSELSEKSRGSLLAKNILQAIIIPELTKEVNEDKNFAQLRQVYNSLILAIWYKKKIKNSILAQVYEDRNKVAGVNINNQQEKQKIYERYLQSFKKGVYNYIQEDHDPVTGQTMPRKYFSGGVTFLDSAMVTFTSKAPQEVPSNQNKVMVTAHLLDYRDAGVIKDSAMTVTKMSPEETANLMVGLKYERPFYDATNRQIILLNTNREKNITLPVKELSDTDGINTGLIDDFKKGFKLKDLEIKAITLNSASRESGIYGVAVGGIAYVREDILKRSTPTQLAEVIQRIALLVPEYKDRKFNKPKPGNPDLKQLLDTIGGDKGASDTGHAVATVNKLSIPSVAELLSLLQKERVPVIAVGFGQLGYGLLLSPDERLDYMTRVLNRHEFTEFDKDQFLKERHFTGLFIAEGDNLLGEIAKTLRIGKAKLAADLLQEGDLSIDIPYSERFFVIDKSREDQYEGIMKVVFHVLEGYHGYNSRTLEFSEVVNDFERLMFYPVDGLGKFESYAKLSLEEKKALYRRYVIDLNLDPNTEMRSIIEALLRDFEQDIEIQMGNKSFRLSDIFYKGKLSGRKWLRTGGNAQTSAGTVSDTERTRYEDGTSDYLRDLMKKELFSKYSPLFPDWQPINKVVRPSVVFPSSATKDYPDVWDGITEFIDTAAKQQSNVRIVVQPIQMAAKDFYTYGDLFFVGGKIDRYDINKKRQTIFLRIKEENELKDYVFALSSAARNKSSIKGIIYKIEVEDKAMLTEENMASKKVSDKAVTAAPGGIDFNADKLNLQAQNNGGEIKFHLDPAMLQHLQNTPGFIPVIIKIQPVDLRTLLAA